MWQILVWISTRCSTVCVCVCQNSLVANVWQWISVKLEEVGMMLIDQYDSQSRGRRRMLIQRLVCSSTIFINFHVMIDLCLPRSFYEMSRDIGPRPWNDRCLHSTHSGPPARPSCEPRSVRRTRCHVGCIQHHSPTGSLSRAWCVTFHSRQNTISSVICSARLVLISAQFQLHIYYSLPNFTSTS